MFTAGHRKIVANRGRSMCRTTISGSLIGWALIGCHGADQNAAACRNANPAVSIPACTRILESGGLRDSARAAALYSRGLGYRTRGDGDLAIADYDAAITLSPDFASAFNSRGLVYQVKGNLGQAVADFTQAIRINPAFGGALKNRGRAEFYLARFADAGNDLRAGLQFDSSNTYNVIWLHLAMMRLGQDDSADFRAQLVRTDSVKWPAPVLRFYLRQMTEDQLMTAAAADTTSGIDQRCAAAFYVGESDLWQHRTDAAIARFRETTATCRNDYTEYLGAAAELARAGANRP